MRPSPSPSFPGPRLAVTAAALLLCASASPSSPSSAPPSPLPLSALAVHHLFDGIGALSAGASSRLLFDYPEPQRSDILDLLFLPSHGASIHILKVEIPGDAQSTDGSESSHMHTREDLSCTRGYETWLLREAKRRNPSIITYGLSWAVPRWVGDGTGNGTGFFSGDNILYHVKWLECVRDASNVVIDLLGNWNEKPMGPTSYIVDLRAALDAANFSSTTIALMDSDYSINNVVAEAVADPAFNASFGSIGRHYACDTPYPSIESVLHKPFWSTEDSSAANDWSGASCWARLLNTNYIYMNMTSTIAWSLVWSAPLGLPFLGAGLLTANQPWTGRYSGGDGASPPGPPLPLPAALNGPLWTTAHTTQFVQPGWRYLSVPGNGSGLLPSSMGNGSFVTLVPPADLSGLTIIIEKVVGPCRCTPSPSTGDTADGVVSFLLTDGLVGPGTVLQVWRTNETVQFWRDADVVVAPDSTLSVLVARDSIVTLSTVGTAAHGAPSSPIPAPGPFPLPYADDFSSYPEDATPVRFFSDQTGSFAARGGALVQVVPIDPGPNRWVNEDVDPITLIGDPALANLTVAVAVQSFSPAGNASGPGVGAFGYTYVQVCARVTNYSGLHNGPPPGYCLAVNATGAWLARAGAVVLAQGQLQGPFAPPTPSTAPLNLTLTLVGEAVAGWAGSGDTTTMQPLFSVMSGAYASGLVALGSGYHPAAFTNFTLVPASTPPPPKRTATTATTTTRTVL
jgi:galactosylceramidase